MWAFVLTVFHLVAPTIDCLDDTLFAGQRREHVGQVFIVGNSVTGFDTILEGTVIYSGDKIRPWKLAVSEWLLLLQHYGKFDISRGKVPRCRLSEAYGDRFIIRDVFIEFPEKDRVQGQR